MNKFTSGGVALLLVAALAGCGGKSGNEQNSNTAGSGATTGGATTGGATAGGATAGGAPATDTTAAPAGGAAFSVAGLDDGPRAGTEPIDAAKAAEGAKLFTTKICATCHGFGRKITCPDLNGVTSRRTAKWIKGQIMHPDVMTHEDPTSKALFAQYKTQMPNQHLSDEVAGQLLEYLKQRNKAGK